MEAMQQAYGSAVAARRATPDEIRRQPEFQYLTSWASFYNKNKVRGQLRPHTAATENLVSRTQQKLLTNESLQSIGPENFRGNKGILRLDQNKCPPGITRHGYRNRRSSLGFPSGEKEADSEVSVYKDIEHLLQADHHWSDEIPELCSANKVTSEGQKVTPRKKSIRFVGAFNLRDNTKDACSKSHIKITNQNDTDIPRNESHTHGDDKKDMLLHSADKNTPTLLEPCHDAECKKVEFGVGDNPYLNVVKANKPANCEQAKHGGNCKGDGKLLAFTKMDSCQSNRLTKAMTIVDPNLFYKQYNEQISNEGVKTAVNTNEIGISQKQNSRGVSNRKHQMGVERSNSNYDADLEKCDKYLRSQSRTFTQTSQYMSNTKRGLSNLSVHYSQTNTAHNDRVIMSDLLKNGHVRNALIGDSIYAIERRLYNRRINPLKSTTFYDRFAAIQPGTQNQTTPSARKRKPRTVADRAKERQERINKKKEELERGFPPRAWSLVELGEEDIEHMLNTCRYLRVDIRKQPNVYGTVDLSDKD